MKDSASKVWGNPRNQSFDLTCTDMVHPDDAGEPDAIVQRKGSPLFHEADEAIGLPATGRDITERKQLETDRGESEQRFRLFFENAPEYCYMISTDGRIVDINKSALMALRYTKEEVLGRPLLTTIYAPSSRTKAKRLFETWRKTGQLRDEELSIVTKNGEKRTVLLSANSITDDNGKLIQSISIQKDITERMRMEEEIRNLATFPSENPNPVLRITTDGVILYANAAALLLLGLETRGIGQLAPPHWRELAVYGLSSGVTTEIEIEHDDKTFIFKLVPLPDKAYVTMFGNDITERKRQETILQNLTITHEKVDAFDLIIAALAKHEKEQDTLNNELRIISERLRTYVDSSTRPTN